MMRVLSNSAMQVERSRFLPVEQYECTEDRKGDANGYKLKTVKDQITFAVPQVREGCFYHSALEKGLRSERALTISLAEMYVQGVSTRKVKVITEQFLGLRSQPHKLAGRHLIWTKSFRSGEKSLWERSNIFT